MRALIILIIVAILGFFGYEYASNGKSPMDVLSGRDPMAEAAAAAAADATAAAEVAAAEAAAATEAAAAEAAAATEAAAADAAAAVEGAAEAVTDGAAAVTDAAAADATAAEQAAADAAAAEAAAATPAMSMDELLDPANFDLAKVTAAIEASGMDAALKTQLTTAVTRAADFPGLLPTVLERIKAAMAG
jgi:colicin import membrane protein